MIPFYRPSVSSEESMAIAKVGEKEYAINLEYRKTHNANPVDNLISK